MNSQETMKTFHELDQWWWSSHQRLFLIVIYLKNLKIWHPDGRNVQISKHCCFRAAKRKKPIFEFIIKSRPNNIIMELHHLHDGTTLYSQKVNAYILSCTTISGPKLKRSPLQDHIYAGFFGWQTIIMHIPKTQKENWCKRIKVHNVWKDKVQALRRRSQICTEASTRQA